MVWRIESSCVGIDVFSYPWSPPPCDGIFIGNFLHGFRRRALQARLFEAFERLTPGGRIWIHEMIWNENKDGPLMTAMCNATMRSGGAGRQRTAAELMSLLRSAGFISPYVVPTAGAFALVAARKPSLLGGPDRPRRGHVGGEGAEVSAKSL